MRKSKLIKRALLTSILTLLMSVTCLIGTSFAWFTDTASVSIKKIEAGNLDITVEAKNPNYDENVEGSKQWEDAENKTIEWVDSEGKAIQDQANILWEPGSTYKLQELRISNSGDLALKYKIVISGIGGNAKLNKAITWTIQLDGVTYDANKEYELNANDNNYDVLTILGTMDDVGSEYQNLSIDDITITVLATQDAVEYDSNNNEYDKKSKYPAYIGPKISTSESYIGKYADINADGTVDGVIFADLAFSKNGTWGSNSFSYSYTAIDSANLKEYYISQTSYADDFGTHEVVSPVSGTSGSDRFYIMTLDDSISGQLYKSGSNSSSTSIDFGSGKQNTSNLKNDLSDQIQTQIDNGWFVPSCGEWCAFADLFKITKENYGSYGLYNHYSTSSLKSVVQAHRVFFGNDSSIAPYISEDNLDTTRNNTRLVTTF